MIKEFVCLAAILAITQSLSVTPTGRQGTWNRYYGFTQDDIRNPIDLSVVSIDASALDASRPTVIIVHGEEGSLSTSLNPLVKDEILRYNDVNVVIVDWSTFANLGYDVAVAAVPSVGLYLAEFVRDLINENFSYNDIHLIGFDLGAHVCGFAGRDLGGSIAKITALDPSARRWGTGSGLVSKDDARVVEVIHTNGGHLGLGSAIGHIDYFINGGSSQPGCLTNSCSHIRAYEIMAASASTSINGNLCTGMTQMRWNLCRGQNLEVGTIDVGKPGSGIYRANTGRNFPYA